MKRNFLLIVLGIAIALSSIAFPLMIGKAIDTYQRTAKIDAFFLFLASAAIIITPCLRFSANLTLRKLNARTREHLKKSLITSIVRPGKINLSQGLVVDLVDGDTDGAIYLYHGKHLDIASNMAQLIFTFSVILYTHSVFATAPAAAIIFSVIVHLLFRKKLPHLYNSYVEQNTRYIDNVCTGINTNKKISSSENEAARSNILRAFLFASSKVATLEFLSSLSYLLGLGVLVTLATQAISQGTASAGALISSALYIEKALIPVFGLISIYYSTAECLTRKQRINKNLRIIFP